MSHFIFKQQLQDLLSTIEPSSKTSSTTSTQTESQVTDQDSHTHIEISQPPCTVTFNHKEWTYYWINTVEHCNQAVAYLNQGTRYYIDTEFQEIKRKSYLSLIQISFDDVIFVIDCYEIGPHKKLAQCLAQSNKEWILHDARMDVTLLCSFFDIPMPSRIFDTQVAWGFQHSNASIGLSLLTYLKLSYESDKSLQTVRFLKRPLPESWIKYAALDIPPLVELYPLLKQDLSSDYLEGVYQVSYERTHNFLTIYQNKQSNNQHQVHASHTQSISSKHTSDQSSVAMYLPLEAPLDATPSHPQFYQGLQNFKYHLWSLKPQQLQALRAMIQWRSEVEIHSPLDRLFPTKKLWIKIARISPKKLEDFSKVQGLHTTWLQDYASSCIMRLHYAYVDVPQEWSEDAMHPWSSEYRADAIVHSNFNSEMLNAWIHLLFIQCAKKLTIASAYLIDAKMIKKLSWPDTWDTQDHMPTAENIWEYLNHQLPILSEGWRKELLFPLLKELVLNHQWE